jgi:hypothetical protein
MTTPDSPATHTGIMTWPLETMNGPEGKRTIDLWECEYGWTGNGFRWKKDGTEPQAYVTEAGEYKWIETYFTLFGLDVSSIRPRTPAEMREFYQEAVEAAGEFRTQLRSEKERATENLRAATAAHLAAIKALADFDKEHGTGGDS